MLRGARYGGEGILRRIRTNAGQVDVARIIDHRSGVTNGRTISHRAVIKASRSSVDKILSAALYFSGLEISVLTWSTF
jgi:hypothetical protein